MAFNLYSFLTVKEQTQYVSEATIALSFVLGIEIYLFLIYEKNNRDPFITILCIQNILFHLFRIGTLTFFPNSLALSRDDYSYEDINYALVFIIVCNLAIFLAVFFLRHKNNATKDDYSRIKSFIKNKKSKIHLFFGITIFMSFFAIKIGPDGLITLTRFFNSIFFDLYIVLSLLIMTYFLSNNFFKKGNNIFFWALIIVYVLLHTFLGSRSAILTVFYCFLFSTLAYMSFIRVSKKVLVILTFISILSIPIFAAITFMRITIGDIDRQNISIENVKLIKDYEYDLAEIEVLLSPVFQRIGFLDFATELISSKDKYSELFSMKFYAMSIVDNIFTPGFDVFDIPKTANAQKFFYEDIGRPSKIKVNEEYHSDCFTLYGEFFVLFGGWFAIIPIFFVVYFLKYLYILYHKRNDFFDVMNRVVILLIFFNLLQSFGLDTIIAYIIGYLGTLWLAKKITRFVWVKK